MEACLIAHRFTRNRLPGPLNTRIGYCVQHTGVPFQSARQFAMQKSKESHEERTATEPRDTDLHEVTLSKVNKVDDRVRILRLDLPRPTKFLAGQWLDTYVPQVPKAGGFTIISSPTAAEASKSPHLELAVQDAPLNPAAAWLWRPESEILGQMLKIRIGGSFVCPPSEGLGGVKKIVLVAGGVGVNPLASMLGYLADAKLDIEVTVLFGSKVSNRVEDVVLLDRILDFYKDGSIKGRVEMFVTGKDNIQSGHQEIRGVQVKVNKGRMSADTVVQQIKPLGSPAAGLVYVCGPPAMTDEIVDTLTTPLMKNVIRPENVKLEKWW